MKLADSHCHVNDSKFDEDREEIFKRAETELEFIVNIGQRIRKQVRKIPELTFFIDDSLDYIENIDNLLKK